MLTLSFLSYASIAQNAGVMKGTVRDPETKQNLAGATVAVYDAKDSALVKQVVNGSKGFSIKAVPGRKYWIKISYSGYRDSVLSLRMNKDSIYDLGPVLLQKNTGELMEVIVKSTIPPVIIKNDTLQFNASSFKTRPNATVEELLKKLPGIEIDRNGNITMQGEKVEKIYINGRDYYLNDPKLLTQNMLADMVSKVEVFDEKTKRSKLTGIPDDNRGKAINFRMKKNDGIYGNVHAAYSGEGRYDAGITANQFKNDEFVLLEATANKTGTHNIYSDGKQVKLNYRNKLGKKISYGLSVTGNRYLNKSESVNERQIFFTDSSLFQNTFVNGSGNNKGQSGNATIQYKIDSLTNLDITSNFSLNNSDNFSSNNVNSDVKKMTKTIPVNNAFTNNTIKGRVKNFNFNINYVHAFYKQGRSISFSLNGSGNNNTTEGNLNSLIRYYDSSAAPSDSVKRDQFFGQLTRNSNYSFGIGYTEPVGEKQVLDAYYSVNNGSGENNRGTLNFNEVTKSYDIPDTGTTNRFENHTKDQSFGIGYNNFRNKKIRYQAGIGVSKNLQDNKDLIKEARSIRQSTMNIYPRASLQYSISKQQNIEVGYSGGTRRPTLQELEPIPDFTNPLFIRTGNPLLKTEFNNQIRAQYRNYDSKRTSSISASINYRNTLNHIINSVVTNAQGVQESKAVNLQSDYGADASLDYDRNLTKSVKGFQLRSRTTVRFTRDANLINTEVNKRHMTYLRQGIYLDYHYGEKLFVNANAELSIDDTRYSIQTNNNVKMIQQNYSASVSYEFPGQLVISSDCYIVYNTAQGRLANQSSTVCNASLMKKFFKQSGELRFSVLDILNNRSNFNQSVGENYIQVSRMEVVKRMFSLGIYWRFAK